MEKEELREKIVQHVVKFLEKSDILQDTREEAEKNNWSIDDMTGAINSLAANEKVILENYSKQRDQLTDEGLQSAEKGSPEVRLWEMAKNGVQKKDLVDLLGKEGAQVGFSTCMSKKWIKYDKQTDMITSTVEKVVDETRELLLKFKSGEKMTENQIKELKKKKFFKQV